MRRVPNVKQGATAFRTWLLPTGKAQGGAASSLATEVVRRPPDGSADPPYTELPSDEGVAATNGQVHTTAVEADTLAMNEAYGIDAARETTREETQEQQEEVWRTPSPRRLSPRKPSPNGEADPGVVEDLQEEEQSVQQEKTSEDPEEEALRQLSPKSSLSFSHSQDVDENVWRYQPPMMRSLKAHFFLHDKGELRNARTGHASSDTGIPVHAGRTRRRILALASGTLVAGLVAAVVLRVRRSQQAAADDDPDSREVSKADFRAHMDRIYGSPEATFAAMDGDGNGQASFDTFADELHRFWPALNLSQVRYAFAGLDCNEDRTLEEEEFVHGVVDSPGFFGCTTTSTTSTTATTVTTVTNTTTTSTATGTATSTTTSLTSSTTTSRSTTTITTTSITTTRTFTLTTTTTVTQTRTVTSTFTTTSRTVTFTTHTTTATTTTTVRSQGWWNWLDPLKAVNPFQHNGFLHPATTTSATLATTKATTLNSATTQLTTVRPAIVPWTSPTPEVIVQTTLPPEAFLLGSWVSDTGAAFTIHRTSTGQLKFTIQVGLNQEVSSLLEAHGQWLIAELAGVGAVRLRVLKHGATPALLSNFRDITKLEWGPNTISHRTTATTQPPAPISTISPVSPPFMTFYMYRAQDKENYEVMNNNLGNLAGVLWYLHHEVVPLCPRHYGITRILRYKVTMKPTVEVFKAAPYRPTFGPFVAMDKCRCTTPGCPGMWQRYGYAPGCQEQVPGPDYFYPLGVWYSLPGPCPSQDCWHKSPACKASEPGGRCPMPSGTRECTWHLEDAGEIDLDELVGISDHTAFCKAGKKEFVPHLDRGAGVTFWDGYHNKTRCEERVRTVEGLFNSKFPSMPRTMPEPKCLAVPR